MTMSASGELPITVRDGSILNVWKRYLALSPTIHPTLTPFGDALRSIAIVRCDAGADGAGAAISGGASSSTGARPRRRRASSTITSSTGTPTATQNHQRFQIGGFSSSTAPTGQI